ncbi:unnamed protein product [Boreogadus saida]
MRTKQNSSGGAVVTAMCWVSIKLPPMWVKRGLTCQPSARATLIPTEGAAAGRPDEVPSIEVTSDPSWSYTVRIGVTPKRFDRGPELSPGHRSQSDDGAKRTGRCQPVPKTVNVWGVMEEVMEEV